MRIVLIVILPFFLILSCADKEVRTISMDKESLFNEDIKEYYFKALDSAGYYINKMDTIKSLNDNQYNFKISREWYKRSEPIMLAYDYENYLSMNAPNLLKVDIDDYTDIKKRNPKSYQVLEEILFDSDTINNKELYTTLEYLKVRIPYIRKNHIIYKQTDCHHLKMLRDAIVNVATKGITGFDSPMLANSLNDAIHNYEAVRYVLEKYKASFKDKSLYENWVNELSETRAVLQNGDFDSFDRYTFIKNHTNTQLALIYKTSIDWGIKMSMSRPLNPNSVNLFSKDFFNIKMFSPQGAPSLSDERIMLGKTLFNDASLSATGNISCATCHIKDLAFTDGKSKSLGKNEKELQRNSPTLTYAVYQKSFFYDGRSDALEGQIVAVVNNEDEFHNNLDSITKKVKANPNYIKQFNTLYDGEITNYNIRNSIADYIRSLAPFDSKFDRNIQGLESSLTKEEKLGFNLFMGKAACATCHFPPAFNGTVPPKYDVSEFENLGTTKTKNLEEPKLDDDPGQFYPYKVEEKRLFFKTATVRNIGLTAPYMHNGAFDTLEEVIEFYNKGGGQGLGLDVPYQTLPPDALELSSKEKKAIITFLESLTDKEFEENLKLFKNTQSK